MSNSIPTAPARWVTFGSVKRVIVLCPYCNGDEWHKAPVENGSIKQAHCAMLTAEPPVYRLDIINAAEYTAEGKAK